MVESARICPSCRGEYAADVLFCPRDGSPLMDRAKVERGEADRASGQRGSGKGHTELHEDDPYLGLEIAEQFRVEQLIGVGAMGRVYRAHQRGVDRPVAIKILHRDLLRNTSVSSRFQREARVASRLTHPNVVQVLMTGELPRSRPDVGGEAYLVMEFLDGLSLRSALAAAGGSLPLPRALHVVLQVCDAVGEAHAQKIVHRDLKPENVMLVRRGDDRDFAKVLDFGVARIEWADATVATQAGVIFGTARYISPEGARGEPVTAASDVYSLAVMLFQCLAGQAPFDGDSPIAILVQHTSTPAPELRSIERASYVPETIARVVAQALSKEPAARPPTARDLGRALVEAARAGGLRPDELVVRSTLLGDGKSHTLLRSMERTKALELTPSLAERLAGGKATEKTIADEPAPSGHGEPAPSGHGEPAPSGHGAPASTTSPSFPDAWDTPEDESQRSRRWLVVGMCFAIGVLLALVFAIRFGAFSEKTDELAEHARVTRAAMAAGAWESPPERNVLELVRGARARWPDAPVLHQLEQEAASQLVVRAQLLHGEDDAEALRLARLASELDPASGDAERLVASLSAPSPTDSASSAAPAPPAASPANGRGAPQGRAAATPSAAPSAAPAGSFSAGPDASATEPPPPRGGRWL